MRMGDEGSLRRLWDVRNLLNGEWIPDIMVALSSGPLRRAELLERIRSTTTPNGWSGTEGRNLSDSVLQRTLTRLMDCELVEHTRDDGVFPPESWFKLTPPAEELFATLDGPVQWAERHDELIRRAQRRRRGRDDQE